MSNRHDDPLIRVANLKKYFNNSSGLFGDYEFSLDGGALPFRRNLEKVRAVDDVSFEIQSGETLGLVGESGCGKSTLARVLLRLLEPTGGDIYFDGDDLTELSSEELRQKRKDIQIIFQDPQSSLDPRMKVGPIIEEPMKAHGMFDAAGRRDRAEELLDSVGLEAQYYNRYPHEFSGGQRQRINLARALSVDPEFIVLDEPTSALDVSIQAQILNTLEDLQSEFDLTYLFISHDLSVIRHISERVAVMYLGELVEIGDSETIFENPKHPYTRSLLSSIPVPDPRNRGSRSALEGDVPSPINPPTGCRFRTRCPALIAPEKYDLTPVEWGDIREFMRAVDRRTFEGDRPEDVRERFLDGHISDPDCDQLIQDALELVADDDWNEAAALLEREFADESICAKKQPSLEQPELNTQSGRRVACHLHNPPEEDLAINTGDYEM